MTWYNVIGSDVWEGREHVCQDVLCNKVECVTGWHVQQAGMCLRVYCVTRWRWNVSQDFCVKGCDVTVTDSQC